jgi:hypothetical protein
MIFKYELLLKKKLGGLSQNKTYATLLTIVYILLYYSKWHIFAILSHDCSSRLVSDTLEPAVHHGQILLHRHFLCTTQKDFDVCAAILRTNKKTFYEANSRTRLLGRGFKSSIPLVKRKLSPLLFYSYVFALTRATGGLLQHETNFRCHSIPSEAISTAYTLIVRWKAYLLSGIAFQLLTKCVPFFHTDYHEWQKSKRQ